MMRAEPLRCAGSGIGYVGLGRHIRDRAGGVAKGLVQAALVAFGPEPRDVHPVRPGVRARREAVLVDHAAVGIALGHEDVHPHLVDRRGARHALRQLEHARHVALRADPLAVVPIHGLGLMAVRVHGDGLVVVVRAAQIEDLCRAGHLTQHELAEVDARPEHLTLELEDTLARRARQLRECTSGASVLERDVVWRELDAALQKEAGLELGGELVGVLGPHTLMVVGDGVEDGLHPRLELGQLVASLDSGPRVEVALRQVACLDKERQRRTRAARLIQLRWQRARVPDREDGRDGEGVALQEPSHHALGLLDLEVVAAVHLEVAAHRAESCGRHVAVPIVRARRVDHVPVGVGLKVDEEPVTEVAALPTGQGPGVHLKLGNVRRCLGPVPIEMHAAGGRKYAGPLLEIVRARGPDQVVPPLEDLHARYDNVEHDDDDDDNGAAGAASPFPLGGLLLGGLQGRSLLKFFIRRGLPLGRNWHSAQPPRSAT
mmetsp:Transcript_19610/g.49398  ORF Transcript_19610/g.49398 Transcript_19610/m.49398 type:complete len:488 (+) Transcript_19610:160-1623(+)